VQRFVRKRRGTQTPEARVVIVTAAGQEAQVDYGTGPMVRDPESRKYRRTRLFVMTLGCSGGGVGIFPVPIAIPVKRDARGDARGHKPQVVHHLSRRGD
jgi:hypothetical protein